MRPHVSETCVTGFAGFASRAEAHSYCLCSLVTDRLKIASTVPRNGSNGAARTRFSILVDLETLANVRNLNPFKDPMKWMEIASKMQELLWQPFTAHAVVSNHTLLGQ